MTAAAPAGLAAPAPSRQDRAMQPETPAQDPPQTAACRRFRLPDEAATRAFARALRPHLRPGDVIALSGPIGAGKTAFARALIQDPGMTSARVKLAVAKAYLGKRREALGILEEVLAADPENEDARTNYENIRESLEPPGQESEDDDG